MVTPMDQVVPPMDQVVAHKIQVVAPRSQVVVPRSQVVPRDQLVLRMHLLAAPRDQVARGVLALKRPQRIPFLEVDFV